MTDGKNLNGQLRAIIDELVFRGLSLDQARREFEKQYIVAALHWHDGNLSQVARELGVHRNTLRNKIASLEIPAADLPERLARRTRQ